jgi:sec-independent protein translocase protein TatC
MSHDQEQSIFEHLAELRTRLVKAALALVVAFVISLLFTKQALQLLLNMIGTTPPQAIRPTETIIVYFRIALIEALVLSMPVIVYQLARYVLPGLLPHEKKYLILMLPGVGVLFASGVSFTVFVLLPFYINFLQGFLSDIVENRWTLDYYVDFATRSMFWMGIVFQMPLVLFFLAKVGVVDAKKLSRFRKYAIVLTAIIAAIITPTTDPVTMMVVMLILYPLYELGIILARFARHGEPSKAVTTT